MADRSMGDQVEVEAVAGGVRFAVRVSPRASRDAVGGTHAGALKVKVTAPPVGGAANAAVLALLAKRLGVPKRAVRVVHGHAGRDKRIEVQGVQPAAVLELGGSAPR